MRKPRTAMMTIAAAVATATLSIGGVALAATGTLPGAADDTATTKAPAAELTIPAGEAANEHADERGRSAAQTGDEAETEEAAETAVAEETAEPAPQEEARTHGDEVSDLAKNTELTGREKGAAISELASDGKARAQAPEQAEAEHPGDLPEQAADRADTGVQQRTEHATDGDD